MGVRNKILAIIALIILLIFIAFFILFLIKSESLSLERFKKKFKNIFETVLKDKILLVCSVIVVVFCMYCVYLVVIRFKNYLTILILVIGIFISMGICIDFLAKITQDVVDNFTNNERIREKSLMAILYPIISIIEIKVFFIWISDKVIKGNADIKSTIIAIRSIIMFGSFIFIPLNLILNVYKGIKECMINPQLFKDDVNRNIKKIKIALAITWFFIIIINSTNIVYFCSNIYPNMFKDTTITDGAHIIRISSAFYFSLITLLTIGYGDITPVGATGRTITSFIAIMGSAYLLIALGSILSEDNGNDNVNKAIKSTENKNDIAHKRKD